MVYLQAGTVATLTVNREIPTGYVLTNGKVEVLLHISEVVGDIAADQDIDVFLYQDKKDQLIATMTIPTVSQDTYEWCPVVEVVTHLGVFVDIGIKKDLLVSKDDLPLYKGVWPITGDELLVALVTDNKGKLLAKLASASVAEEATVIAPESLLKQPISGRVYYTNREGSVIMTEEGYRGFIHHTERKEEPRLGSWVEGRVIDVKADGTLNVSLRPLKQNVMDDDAEEILTYLKSHNGVMLLSDKSDPDAVRDTFKISKAAFKRALGRLLKERKIEQREGKTFLTENSTKE